MSTLADRLEALGRERLRGMLRGLEKESLRTLPNGRLALTPHPAELGSPLTHPHITTDFSESQLELVTGVHHRVEDVLDELTRIHQNVCHVLAQHGQERMWPSSMPCGLPTDETIPLGRYGNSNIGRAKSVYRMGLGHRYGRRMQTISGIHYNWSLPGLDNAAYFGLIRNFHRHSFVLLVLFGASPVVCHTFVEGRNHGLQALGETGSMYLPYATTLRMGRLGYQSDAQGTLHVSYNSLEGYAASLHTALTQPYAPYEAIGIRNLGGEYNQLDTSLLQIENEFYGTIRPKRVIRRGERPLHALCERGVEYIEVRLLDLNPFISIGIDANTIRFLDIYLLHSLLLHSPPDTPEEIDTLKQTQHLTASRGREPGLHVQHLDGDVELLRYATEVVADMAPLAERLDAMLGTGTQYQQAIAAAQHALAHPAQLPSARVLQAVADSGNCFVTFSAQQAQQAHQALLAAPFAPDEQRRFADMAAQSLQAQKAIETADTMPFEAFRQYYVAADRLWQQG